ncbi:MAG: helix-turn-helix domain-containing protein [Pirellulaceae bacterium]|nr:helix-turn-helix domain-containing protein [Pirellulaceae bacterium]
MRTENATLPTTEPRLIDVAAVARMLGVTGRTVYRLADAGRMPKPLRLGGAVRWDRRTIENWIDSGCPSDQEGTRR